MGRPQRSPLLGYNHNVKYRGRIFHVQTEDSGPVNPRIFTHLYYEGTIVASKKVEYDGTSPEEVVRSLMQSQHKAILKELKTARHDARIANFFASRGEAMDAAESVGAERALDLDAVPVTPAPTPAPMSHLDGGDTEPNPPAADLVERVEFEEGTPYEETPLPYVPPMALPPAPRDPGGRAPPPPVVVIPAPGGRPRRPTRPAAPSPHTPVVVQRTVVVGVGRAAGVPGATPPPRRRPAPAIPYVVKEGSHPLARPPEFTPTPQIQPVAPSATAEGAPWSSVQPGKAASEPLVEKSLDEVILAYLAQGGEGEGR